MGTKETIILWVSKLYADAYTNMFIGNAVQDAMGDGEGTAAGISQTVFSMCLDTVAPLLCSVGIAIAVTFFLIALIELSTTERLTLEFFIKFFSKLVVSIFIISICPQLLEACISFGNGLANLISSETSATSMTYNQILKMYYDYYMEVGGSWIILVIKAFGSIMIINIVSYVLVAIVYVVSFTRTLELGVRGALMPIALGLLSDDGWRGAGGRYIRKFIAICSQGAVLILIGKLANVAMLACADVQISQIAGENTMSFIVMLGVAFAAASLMFKSIGIINDVFGG